MSVLSRPRVLLITLDAFGTLYRPRGSIASQYLDVAKSCGLHVEADVKTFGHEFRNAFRTHYSRSPNYGKARGMRPEVWWTHVVNDTFKSLIPQGQTVPPDLSKALFEHFSSRKGYELFPDVMLFLQQMKHWKRNLAPELAVKDVVVGVLTNSDPRVAGVLETLGVLVDREQSHGVYRRRRRDQFDIDFVLTSYEIGTEKPDRAVFAEAEQVARRRLGLASLSSEHTTTEDDLDGIDGVVKVHIGDDLHKDYWGATRSGYGWHSLLLDRDADEEETPYHEVKHITGLMRAQAVLMALLQGGP